MSLFFVLLLLFFFNQINVALVSIRYFFQKHYKKNLTDLNLLNSSMF